MPKGVCIINCHKPEPPVPSGSGSGSGSGGGGTGSGSGSGGGGTGSGSGSGSGGGGTGSGSGSGGGGTGSGSGSGGGGTGSGSGSGGGGTGSGSGSGGGGTGSGSGSGGGGTGSGSGSGGGGTGSGSGSGGGGTGSGSGSGGGGTGSGSGSGSGSSSTFNIEPWGAYSVTLMSNSGPATAAQGPTAPAHFNMETISERWIEFCKNRMRNDFLIDRSMFCIAGCPTQGRDSLLPPPAAAYDVNPKMDYAIINSSYFEYDTTSTNIIVSNGSGTLPDVFRRYLWDEENCTGMVWENKHGGFRGPADPRNVPGSGSGIAQIIELGLTLDMESTWTQFIPNCSTLIGSGPGPFSYPSGSGAIFEANPKTPLVPYLTLKNHLVEQGVDFGSGTASEILSDEFNNVENEVYITGAGCYGSGLGNCVGGNNYYYGAHPRELYLNLYTNVAQCFGYIAYMNKLLASQHGPGGSGVGRGQRITSCSWDNEGNSWPDYNSYVMIVLHSGLDSKSLAKFNTLYNNFSSDSTGEYFINHPWYLMQATAQYGRYGFNPIVGPLLVTGIWQGSNSGSGASTMPAVGSGMGIDCPYFVISVSQSNIEGIVPTGSEYNYPTVPSTSGYSYPNMKNGFGFHKTQFAAPYSSGGPTGFGSSGCGGHINNGQDDNDCYSGHKSFAVEYEGSQGEVQYYWNSTCQRWNSSGSGEFISMSRPGSGEWATCIAPNPPTPPNFGLNNQINNGRTIRKCDSGSGIYQQTQNTPTLCTWLIEKDVLIQSINEGISTGSGIAHPTYSGYYPAEDPGYDHPSGPFGKSSWKLPSAYSSLDVHAAGSGGYIDGIEVWAVQKYNGDLNWFPQRDSQHIPQLSGQVIVDYLWHRIINAEHISKIVATGGIGTVEEVALEWAFGDFTNSLGSGNGCDHWNLRDGPFKPNWSSTSTISGTTLLDIPDCEHGTDRKYQEMYDLFEIDKNPAMWTWGSGSGSGIFADTPYKFDIPGSYCNLNSGLASLNKVNIPIGAAVTSLTCVDSTATLMGWDGKPRYATNSLSNTTECPSGDKYIGCGKCWGSGTGGGVYYTKYQQYIGVNGSKYAAAAIIENESKGNAIAWPGGAPSYIVGGTDIRDLISGTDPTYLPTATKQNLLQYIGSGIDHASPGGLGLHNGGIARLILSPWTSLASKKFQAGIYASKWGQYQSYNNENGVILNFAVNSLSIVQQNAGSGSDWDQLQYTSWPVAAMTGSSPQFTWPSSTSDHGMDNPKMVANTNPIAVPALSSPYEAQGLFLGGVSGTEDQFGCWKFKDFKAVLDLSCYELRSEYPDDYGAPGTIDPNKKIVKLGMYDIIQMPLAWVNAPSK